jgi:GDP/UDP-N,N'-diacetylbacillosamine 2-epimerase (hydrolysing)
MKKICVVTGTRAEYGLLRWVMEGIRRSKLLELQLIVTGMHLSPEFGMTVTAIENDNFKVDQRVEMLLSSDSAVGVSKSLGLGVIGFADALTALQPDMMLVLGDRYEILAASIAAMVARVPIAHVHGGEATEGLIDEAIRHSITKMAHLHFVAAKEYERRVIQLGEQPNRVFLVGGLGVDGIQRMNMLKKEELENLIDFEFAPRNLLITYHPVTLECKTSTLQMDELLAALAECENTGLIFTMPNADVDGRCLISQIQKFCANHPRARVYPSLGQMLYLSCVAHVDGVIGNSSSGLTEVPSLKKGTINIGDRQLGRLRAASVIDCPPEKGAIRAAIQTLYSSEFQSRIASVESPYGNGGASEKIVKLLEDTAFDDLIKKPFYDCAFL